VISALEVGDLKSAPVTPAERTLLELVELLTRHAYRTTDGDVERVRSAGWTDAQIAEAVYITALFAFFNRVADAFGLEDPQYRELAAAGTVAGLPGRDMSAAQVSES
jgi:alkylhydroperoxidase family enzyme